MASLASEQISPEDRIVAVMGPTGAGKSTFIERATGGDGRNFVSHNWHSSTNEFRSVRVNHPDYIHPIVFVDTPGFDHTCISDAEILAMITEWLMRIYRGNANLVTILYLHRISDNRMSGSAMKNLRTFSSICGESAMPKVIIVTTMWSKVGEEEGTEREELLKREVWGDILGKGFSVKRFGDTRQSAWDIVGDTVEKGSGVPLLIQEEMDGDRKPLNATKAAIHLKETTENVPKGLLKNMRRGFLWFFRLER